MALSGGWYAKWLYEAIVAVGWHPFLRINRQGTYCPTDSDTFPPADGADSRTLAKKSLHAKRPS
jgi:hypothetical protein